MKKYTIISLFILFAFSNLYSQSVGFITLKDGYNSALTLAQTTNPSAYLVAVLTANKEITLPNIEGILKGEIKFEGEDIGKSNFWSYIFYDTLNQVKIEIVSILMNDQIKSTETIVFSEEVKLGTSLNNFDFNQIINSDLVIEKVVSSNLFHTLPDSINCDTNTINIMTGVFAMTNEWGDQSNHLWHYWLDCGGLHSYCNGPYNYLIMACNYENIQEQNDLLDISIIPNPAKNKIIIKTEEIVNKIDILNLNGELINSYKSNIIDISNYVTGIYFIKFYINDRIYIKTFIKE